MSARATIAGVAASTMLAAASAVLSVPVAQGQPTEVALRGDAIARAQVAVDRQAAVGTLTIPALRTGRVPVRRVGSSGGAIRIPQNARTVGWWRGSRGFSARQGSSIVVGHVSGDRDVPGALYRLPRLHRGDRIVWRIGGQRRVFRVVAKTYTPRTADLPDRIWRLDGRRTLNLITCARKRTERDGFYHYTHNLTVTAVLVSRS